MKASSAVKDYVVWVYFYSSERMASAEKYVHRRRLTLTVCKQQEIIGQRPSQVAQSYNRWKKELSQWTYKGILNQI